MQNPICPICKNQLHNFENYQECTTCQTNVSTNFNYIFFYIIFNKITTIQDLNNIQFTITFNPKTNELSIFNFSQGKTTRFISEPNITSIKSTALKFLKNSYLS